MPEVDLNELERYLRIYQQNPDSRVFAPLADMYRRLSRFKEAEQICREGLQRHPYYAGGKVALAYLLLDTHRLDEALDEIQQVVTYYPDNLMARKILVRVLAGMGESQRANREYQALLQLAPQLRGDEELERALQSGVVGAWDEAPPQVRQARVLQRTNDAERMGAEETELESAPEKTEAGHFEGSNPRRARSKRELLLKKKRVVERWLATLEAR